MTSERDFDRIARAWLELGPAEAPERVVAAVLQAVEAEPQPRRGFLRPTRRTFQMNRLPMAAAIAAALVVVIGGGAILLNGSGPSSTVGGSATPTTSSVISPSPAPPKATPASPGTTASGSIGAADTIPASLFGDWVGAPRTVAGLPARYRFRFAINHDGTLTFPNDTYTAGDLNSDVAVGDPPDVLVLRSRESRDGCQSGDIGHYRWVMSTLSVHLSLTAIDDACTTRSAALAGDWTHVQCRNADGGCFGFLDAGSYSSQYFAPRLAVGADWVPDYGALTYAVPDGWANRGDFPRAFELTPATDYAAEGPDGPDGGFHEIAVYATPALADPTDCSTPVKGGPTTAGGLVGALRARPGLVTTAPQVMTVDGLPARAIDLTMAKGWTAKCPGDTSPGVPMLTSADKRWSYGVGLGGTPNGANEHQRLIAVDIGPGQVIVIEIDSTHPDRWEQLLTAAMPIIVSFHFR